MRARGARAAGTEAALETVALADSLRCRGVVAVDLSGNPSLGAWATWQPALADARRRGLPLTLHCGEVDNADEARRRGARAPRRLRQR